MYVSFSPSVILLDHDTIPFGRIPIFRSCSSSSENRRLPHGAGNLRRLFGSLSFLSDASSSRNLSEWKSARERILCWPSTISYRIDSRPANPFAHIWQANRRDGVLPEDRVDQAMYLRLRPGDATLVLFVDL